jgi:hypothetical protein
MMRARCSRFAGQVFGKAVVRHVVGFYAECVLDALGGALAVVGANLDWPWYAPHWDMAIPEQIETHGRCSPRLAASPPSVRSAPMNVPASPIGAQPLMSSDGVPVINVEPICQGNYSAREQ